MTEDPQVSAILDETEKLLESFIAEAKEANKKAVIVMRFSGYERRQVQARMNKIIQPPYRYNSASPPSGKKELEPGRNEWISVPDTNQQAGYRSVAVHVPSGIPCTKNNTGQDCLVVLWD